MILFEVWELLVVYNNCTGMIGNMISTPFIWQSLHESSGKRIIFMCSTFLASELSRKAPGHNLFHGAKVVMC
jgi:hypothetical protein